MDTNAWTGGWLPMWIIGAPLLFAVIERLRTPSATSRSDASAAYGTGTAARVSR